MTAAPMRHDARVLQTSVRVTQGRGLTAPARFVEREASVSQRTGDALCEEGTPLAHARLVHVAAVAQVPAPASARRGLRLGIGYAQQLAERCECRASELALLLGPQSLVEVTHAETRSKLCRRVHAWRRPIASARAESDSALLKQQTDPKKAQRWRARSGQTWGRVLPMAASFATTSPMVTGIFQNPAVLRAFTSMQSASSDSAAHPG